MIYYVFTEAECKAINAALDLVVLEEEYERGYVKELRKVITPQVATVYAPKAVVILYSLITVALLDYSESLSIEHVLVLDTVRAKLEPVCVKWKESQPPTEGTKP